MLAQGEIHLSGLGVLAAHLTDANHRELLAGAAGKSKRAIEELVAARFSSKDILPFKVTEDAAAMGRPTEPQPPEREAVAGPYEKPEEQRWSRRIRFARRVPSMAHVETS